MLLKKKNTSLTATKCTTIYSELYTRLVPYEFVKSKKLIKLVVAATQLYSLQLGSYTCLHNQRPVTFSALNYVYASTSTFEIAYSL